MTENRMAKITQFEKTVVDTNIHIGELLEVIDTNSEEIATIQLTISDKDSVTKKLKDLEEMDRRTVKYRV